jgi:DNA-binding GntR family transcriptional regulator
LRSQPKFLAEVLMTTHIAISRSVCPGAEAHIGILDAIVAGDSPTAQRLLASHADIQKNDFAQYISIVEAAESRR